MKTRFFLQRRPATAMPMPLHLSRGGLGSVVAVCSRDAGVAVRRTVTPGRGQSRSVAPSRTLLGKKRFFFCGANLQNPTRRTYSSGGRDAVTAVKIAPTNGYSKPLKTPPPPLFKDRGQKSEAGDQIQAFVSWRLCVRLQNQARK